MKAYVNAYQLFCSAGDCNELMRSIYAKQSAISIDDSYIRDTPVGLGMLPEGEFFECLEETVGKVLDTCSLESFSDTLLIVGSSVGGMKESESHYFSDKNYSNIDPSRHAINVIGDVLQDRFGFCDTRALSTACTSSANALLLAKRLINVGAYENILVVGADSLCFTTVCGFHALGVLSQERCSPFDKKRSGMNVAEGIGALLLQNAKTDESIELLGAGASSDAYHMANPDPEAAGAISAMQNALDDAGLSTDAIDYINAHGTATEANDRVEALAITTLFDAVHVSSSKAVTGHALGAAGAIEAIVSCEVIKRDLIPAQCGLVEAENTAINLPKENIPKKIKYVMSNSFAFGGNNTALVFGA